MLASGRDGAQGDPVTELIHELCPRPIDVAGWALVAVVVMCVVKAVRL